jgi:hypothetical protein
MTYEAALFTGYEYLRRPIPRHLGSRGDGWLSREYVIKGLTGVGPFTTSGEHPFPSAVTFFDSTQCDWEVRNERRDYQMRKWGLDY